MRFARLDLLRFGHFRDTSIELPSGARDLHLVFGVNEAGKTTTMAAVEDLLFGIRARTPYNFLHENTALRLGAVIEANGDRFEFRRRKGTKNTVIGPGDEPLPGGEERLDELLGAVDRSSFERMFNLDRERLAKGGKEILDPDSDAGQILFSAGSGLVEFRRRRQRLAEEARGLWTPRRAKTPVFYRALAALEETEVALREALRRPREWEALEQAVREAEQERDELQRIYNEKAAESGRFARIRRVSPLVRRGRELEEEWAEVAEAPRLPSDAAAEVERIEHERTRAEAEIAVRTKHLRERQGALDETPLDDALLGARETIQAIRERRITVRQMRSDLPKRRGELSEALHRLRQVASELGWEGLDDTALLARVPTKHRVARAQQLLVDHGATETRHRAAENALEETLRECEEYAGSSLPEPDTVRGFGDRIEAGEAEVRTRESRRKALREQAARQQADRERRIREEQVVTRDRLDGARESRDALWRLVEHRLAGESESTPDLAPRFESALREADAVADRRFDGARAAGQLESLDQAISDLEREASESEEAEATAKKKLAELRSAYGALWDGCPFEPQAPAAMLDWLDRRSSLIEAAEQKRRQRDEARSRLSDWEAGWRAALAELGLDPETTPGGAAEPIERFAGMREDVVRIQELRDKRIGTIERDLVAFESEVRELVGRLAPDLAEVPAEEAAEQLGRRLDEESARQKSRERDEDAARRAQEEVEAAERTLREIAMVLAPLLEAAGAPDLQGLRAAIRRSDQRRALERERSEIEERLQRDGDDLPFEELARECEGLGPDEARARANAAEAERAAAQRTLREAGERVGIARARCEEFRRGSDAADLAAERQERRAAVADAAERYARARASVILIDWALDRFRQERQGPLLERAGELFRTLTGGSFERFEFGFDERDRLQLQAVRPGAEPMAVSGLSSGTEDQLFLALRIAFVEEHVERAVPLPFIVDDLFVNFDDERSAAGFEVLGQLAEKTQVLFFTHHEHLVGIARKVLGAVSVVRLGAPK